MDHQKNKSSPALRASMKPYYEAILLTFSKYQLYILSELGQTLPRA